MKHLAILLLLLGLTLPASAQLAFSPGTLGTPTASPVAGSYVGTQTVTLSDPTTTNAFICYTTDSSTPTGTATSCTNGTHFTVGISVSVTTTIKAAAFEGYWRPSGILTAVYTITGAPVVNTGAQHTCGTVNCTVNFTAPAGTFGVIIHIFDDLSTATLTTVRDCTGSSQCSSSTDTLVAANACSVLNSSIMCEYYICQSALSSGSSSASVFWSAITSNSAIEVEAITGELTSSCLDQTGTNSGGSGSPTATTSGNVGHSGELAIAFTIAGVVPSAGSGYTAIVISGGLGSESSNASPTNGAAATATFTTSSTSWAELISTWRAQ